jgi:hypothetical protein
MNAIAQRIDVETLVEQAGARSWRIDQLVRCRVTLLPS